MSLIAQITQGYRPQSTLPGLYIVATPIGNLSDITVRALELLGTVDYILAEDTRVTGGLLHRYGISAKMVSCREAMPTPAFLRVAEQVVTDIAAGKRVALVSDAGTPGISDPGNRMVAAVRQAGLPIVPIPGPSALAAILSVSGMALQKPLFVGFLPKKKGRQTLLASLEQAFISQTIDAVIIYESAERLIKTCTELSDSKIKKTFIVGKELTKSFEQIIVTDVVQELPALKGEIVLLVVPSTLVR
jgi:16S rRNA (cytidine1402-2'-O)-methyltransferase